MPTKHEYAAAFSTGLYLSMTVAGGEKAGEVVIHMVEVMNIEGRRWSVVANLPEPLSQLSITLCGDHQAHSGGGGGGFERTPSLATMVHQIAAL